MTLEKININFSGLNNITPLEFDLPSTPSEWLTQIPQRANEVTGGFLGIGILLSVFLLFYIKVTDVSQFGEFRYSRIRGLAIASIIGGLVGINLIQIGFIQDFVTTAILLSIGLLCIIIVKIEER